MISSWLQKTRAAYLLVAAWVLFLIAVSQFLGLWKAQSVLLDRSDPVFFFMSVRVVNILSMLFLLLLAGEFVLGGMLSAERKIIILMLLFGFYCSYYFVTYGLGYSDACPTAFTMHHLSFILSERQIHVVGWAVKLILGLSLCYHFLGSERDRAAGRAV